MSDSQTQSYDESHVSQKKMSSQDLASAFGFQICSEPTAVALSLSTEFYGFPLHPILVTKHTGRSLRTMRAPQKASSWDPANRNLQFGSALCGDQGVQQSQRTVGPTNW